MTARGRPLRALLAAAAVASLASCGGEPPRKGPEGPLRVQVMYAEVDGAGPVDGFSLVGEDGRAHALASQPALDRAVLAATAPAGRYRLVGPAGWAPVGPMEPLPLRGDLAPQPVWVGRMHSLYLLNPPELPVTGVEAVRGDRESGTAPFAVRLESGPDGRSVLRLSPEDWSGPVRVHARLGATHFAQPFKVTLRGDGTPFWAKTEPALMTSFDVLAVPADGRPAAGLEVAGVSRVGGLTVRAAARTNAQGWVRLDPVPADAEAFALEVAPAPGGSVSRWPGEALRRLGEARLLAAPESGAVLSFSWPSRGARVQVRPEGSDTYLVAPGDWSDRPEGGAAFQASLRPGARYHWIVSDADRADASATPVTVGGIVAEFASPTPQAICTLSVRIHGGFITSDVRYELHARRIEDGKEVFLVGGSLRGVMRRDADLSLPAGRYRVRLALGAREGVAKDVDLSEAGSRASLELEAPR